MYSLKLFLLHHSSDRSNRMNLDARFLHLTHTNMIPSDLEALEIQRIISQERDELSNQSSKASEIESPESPASSSVRGRSVLLVSECTRMYEGTISPVHRLPPELVAEIFKLCCSMRTWLPPGPYLDTPQLIVGQICSGWRRVASGLEALWNCVGMTATSTGSGRGDMEIVDAWLSRPGSLDLSFYDSGLTFTDALLLDILLAHVRRCCSIHLRGQNSLVIFSALPPGSFDLLESMTLEVSTVLHFWSQTSFLRSPPRLRSLSLLCFPLTESDSQFLAVSIPWSQLTYLCVRANGSPYTSIYFVGFFHILRICTGLVDCELDFVMDHTVTTLSQYYYPIYSSFVLARVSSHLTVKHCSSDLLHSRHSRNLSFLFRPI